jgi:hypothetical protein
MAASTPAGFHTPANNGLLLRQADPPSAYPLNTTCPVHAVVLCLQQPQASPESERAHNLLAWMPPVSLTDEIRMGTSLSCGCTCGQGTRNDIRAFVHDVDDTLSSSISTPKKPMVVHR